MTLNSLQKMKINVKSKVTYFLFSQFFYNYCFFILLNRKNNVSRGCWKEGRYYWVSPLYKSYRVTLVSWRDKFFHLWQVVHMNNFSLPWLSLKGNIKSHCTTINI